MPTNILNLPAYKVLRVEETEDDYYIRAELAHPNSVVFSMPGEEDETPYRFSFRFVSRFFSCVGSVALVGWDQPRHTRGWSSCQP